MDEYASFKSGGKPPAQRGFPKQLLCPAEGASRPISEEEIRFRAGRKSQNSVSRLLFSVLSVLGRGRHLDPRFLEQAPLCITLEVGSVGVYFFKLEFR